MTTLRITDFDPDLQMLIADMLDAKGLGLAGPQVARSLRLNLARAFQHETDRLDGIMLVDIATSVRRPDAEEACVVEISEAQ